jgi:hypothetical protein
MRLWKLPSGSATDQKFQYSVDLSSAELNKASYASVDSRLMQSWGDYHLCGATWAFTGSDDSGVLVVSGMLARNTGSTPDVNFCASLAGTWEYARVGDGLRLCKAGSCITWE